MKSNIDVDVDALFNIDMISSINRDSTAHIQSILITTGKISKVLLLMEQGEGECFYC